MDIIKLFEARAGYAFKDPSLLEEALLAAGASTCRKNIEGDPRGNKRLALIGDALIQLEIVDQWHTTGVSPCMITHVGTKSQYSPTPRHNTKNHLSKRFEPESRKDWKRSGFNGIYYHTPCSEECQSHYSRIRCRGIGGCSMAGFRQRLRDGL